jgi:hypothetical protein
MNGKLCGKAIDTEEFPKYITTTYFSRNGENLGLKS